MEQLTQKLSNGEMMIQELPIPQLSKGMVLVKNHYSLISAGTEGSTVKAARKSLIGKAKEKPQQVQQVLDSLRTKGITQTYRAVMKKLDAYSPLGYSCAGEIIDVADDVTDFKIGDFVACAGNQYAYHAEVVAVPVNLCVKLRNDADLSLACYNTLGAIAMEGVRQADLRLGETCAVIGLGLIGQLVCLELQASGVRVVGIDVNEAAVNQAAVHCTDRSYIRSTPGIEEQIISYTHGLGVDSVIIAAATSSLDPVNFAGAICRKRGKVIVLGAVPTGFDREPYYYKKELEMKMSCSYGPGRYDLNYEEKGVDYPAAYVRWTEKRNMETFQELIATGKIDISYLTTYTFAFEDAPNLGIYDQIEALRWINKNGKAFGGDINNVTIFGESAGGGSVSLLPLIKEAKGLFHRVIAESGSLALTYAKEECKAFTDKLIKAAKTDSMEELMKLSTEELAKLNEGLNESNNFPMRDGKLIPIDPYEPYQKGETTSIDMIMGTNANELLYWIGELGGLFNYSAGMPIKYKADIAKISKDDMQKVKTFMRVAKGNKVARITEFYNEIMFRLPAIYQAEGHSSNGGNIYMYYWKEESKIPLYKACHAVELAYVFYNLDETIYTGERADEGLAKAVSTMWVNFAKTGNPSLEDIKWSKYDKKKRSTIIFEKDKIREEKEVLEEQRDLLSPIVKYMINPGYADVDANLSVFEKTNAAINAAFSCISTLVAEKIIK